MCIRDRSPAPSYRLPDRGVRILVYLFNAYFRVAYFPLKRCKATVTMVQKPGKDPKFTDPYFRGNTYFCVGVFITCVYVCGYASARARSDRSMQVCV